MKEKIIEKAGELFLKVGFKTVTMDDIAKEMGISKKTIYKFFENKEVLIETCTQVANNGIRETIDLIIKQNYNAIEENFQIRSMLKKMFNTQGDSPAYQLKKHYPEIYGQIILDGINQCDTYFKANIYKGIVEGLYRENVNINNYIKFYYTLIFSIKETTISEAESQKLELDALEYHVRALATSKGVEELEKQLVNFNK